MKRIGYWVTDKKFKKMRFASFHDICRDAGYEAVRIKEPEDLEKQGPFDVFIHKLSDDIGSALDGDEEAKELVQKFQSHFQRCPSLLVIDPFDKVARMIDRREQYQAARDCFQKLQDDQYFIPNFVELTNTDVSSNKKLIEQAGITFPFIYKPAAAHGSAECHHLAVVFNEDGLRDLPPPCVAQNFTNHDAVLYKVYIIGDHIQVVKRPSLKNFKQGGSKESTVFFDSYGVSKPNSNSHLNKLDLKEEEPSDKTVLLSPDLDKVRKMVTALRSSLKLELLGIDLIIEKTTGRYAVIDINSFPGYDGVDNFFEVLLDMLSKRLQPNEREGTRKRKSSEPLEKDLHT
ncbi:inositol-tetrakisphosphate 1-kinase-like [Lingula anatina]|uniref:Inositol-tetrakisphosphate 1-kinase n=1 Tax=Lingula anatina TaxID=7574 RepID=A0A1S3J621_LINAN|nr:inositol-tetrakisphosphate 1-kinase-like [Lingula anatina]|eukprot:XP_013405696.1 inositol-tetrakisphosphate 1-kinase-like [Lingula anatina]